MGELTDFAKSNSKWLRLEDGESQRLRYTGYAFTLDKAGIKKPCYQFLDSSGREKVLSTMSQFLCHFFDEEKGNAKKGNWVRLTRLGIGTDTRYQAEVEIHDSLKDDLKPDTEVPF